MLFFFCLSFFLELLGGGVGWASALGPGFCIHRPMLKWRRRCRTSPNRQSVHMQPPEVLKRELCQAVGKVQSCAKVGALSKPSRRSANDMKYRLPHWRSNRHLSPYDRAMLADDASHIGKICNGVFLIRVPGSGLLYWRCKKWNHNEPVRPYTTWHSPMNGQQCAEHFFEFAHKATDHRQIAGA